jgi:hypothetical protein
MQIPARPRSQNRFQSQWQHDRLLSRTVVAATFMLIAAKLWLG